MRHAATVQADTRLVGEIGRLDDERVAFPMAARIAHICADVFSGMRTAVERNDAGLMNHLGENGHKPWTLHNLGSIAVDHGEYGARHTAGNAAIIQTSIFRTTGNALSDLLKFRLPLLCLSGERRHSPIRRIDNQRSLLGWSSRTLAPVSRRVHAGFGIFCDEFLAVVLGLPLQLGLSLSNLFFRRRRSGSHLSWPLHRHADIVVARPRSL